VQNHMMQLLALISMEPPISLDSDAIRALAPGGRVDS